MSDRFVTLERMLEEKISAIIRTDSREVAHDAMSSAVRGGFRLVEFTLTTPGALALIEAFAENRDLLVGAGTVLSTADVAAAAGAGARFVVSPIFDPVVINAAHEHGLVCMPGAQTPTEMAFAARAGADLVKVFPAPAGGVDYIRAVRGPLPDLRLYPTAGVDADNLGDYLDAGCVGAGFVRSLFHPADLSDGRFDLIERRAAAIVASLAAWRESNA